MSNPSEKTEYLLLSCGKWKSDICAEDIQRAIDEFYVWHAQLVADGKFKPGHRLTTQGKLVSSTDIIDGPFAETKEVIGGYWFIVAESLEEAAEIAAQSPCLPCGLSYEIRPLEYERASAWRITNETPQRP